MQTNIAANRVTWSQIINLGARAGFWSALGYSLLFICYAIVRSGTTIISINEADDAWNTIGATSMSLTFMALLVGIVFAWFSALWGAFTSVMLRVMVEFIDPWGAPSKAISGGGLTGAVLYLLIHASVQAWLGRRVSLAYPETYAFWLILPGIIYLILSAYGGWLIGRKLSRY